jgi:hypothetical protein
MAKLNRMQRKFAQIILYNETPETIDKVLPMLSQEWHDYINEWVDYRIDCLVRKLKEQGYNDVTAMEVLTHVCVNVNDGFIDNNTGDQERNLWYRCYPYLAREVQRRLFEYI